MATPLPDTIEREVARLFDEGEDLLDAEEDRDALTCFQAAWDLIPEPKGKWQRALQVLAAVADCQFFLGDYEACSRTLQFALCNDVAGPADPWICLRLGQCYFELGNEFAAGNWLTAAMMIGDVDMFENEDPKYWAYLKTRLDPPPGGWPAGW